MLNKENCLSVSGAQSLRLGKGIIEFKNYCKQIHCPFKIYCDFECNLEGVEIYEGSYSKKYQKHILCSFAYKVVCSDDRFNKSIVVFKGENAASEFIKAILKEYEHHKKVVRKHFNKNLIISEEEEQYQSSNTCWICKKLIDHDEVKVRDHCHVTGSLEAQLIGVVPNIQLTKNVPVIFHNLRGYDNHVIFNELNEFDVKTDVIPNGLEKYMAFFLNKNLVFIESMQYTNSSLDKLVKNLSDKDLKYLTEEFGSKNLELLKQKGAYPYEYMDSFERFNEKNCLMKNVFTDL